MHCRALVLGLALTAAFTAGCTQTRWMDKDSYDEFYSRLGLPSNLPENPEEGIIPPKVNIKAPANVNEPGREPQYLTLTEAIAMGLENGVTGTRSVRGLGSIDDDLLTLNQGGVTTDSIRVLTLEPAIFGTNIEGQLSRYDVVMRSLLAWRNDDPPSQSPRRFSGGQFVSAGASLEKALATGGLASITFGSPTIPGAPGSDIYNNFSQQSFFSGVANPSWTPDLRFAFSQPLLQGFGVGINQLLSNHPTSGQVQNIGPGPQGILIARLRFDQSRAELERNVAFMLLNIETAYWNLYGAYVNLYSAEQALRQSYEAWRISKAKYDAGSIAITQFAQTRGQYEQFRGDRLVALDRVLDAERILRRLIGLKVEDGKQLVPVDAPTLTPYIPDWNSAVNEAVALRPELVVARQELRARQLELIRVKNQLLPNLNLEASYGLRGFGTRLDGNGSLAPDPNTGVSSTSNALKSLAGAHFADSSIGLRFSMPLGYRLAHAQVRQANLRLAQGYLELRDLEERAQSYLASQYRAVSTAYAVIQARRAQREAFAQQVEARFKEFIAGKTTADFLLEAQRQWANALSTEYQAVVDYNNALARFQFAKGTLLRHDNVVIAEGPLPMCAQVRAVEHERERTRSIVLRERAVPAVNAGCPANGCDRCPPAIPAHEAPSAIHLIGTATDLPDRLPVEVPRGNREETRDGRLVPTSASDTMPGGGNSGEPLTPPPGTHAPASPSSSLLTPRAGSVAQMLPDTVIRPDSN